MNANIKTVIVCISKNSKRFIKRKYPIHPEDGKDLPVFDYDVRKKTYNRVYVWGSALTGALGLPYMKRKENLHRVEFYKSPTRLGFAEKFEVSTAACGFGFTAFGVKTASNLKLYGTGINTDSQIGYHEIKPNSPLDVIFFPRPISLPLLYPEKTEIKKLSAGRAHLLVLTDEGIFVLGNNTYGQCGRCSIPSDKYSGSSYIHHIKNIDEKGIVDIECGQDHSLAITDDGCVYSCGWSADGQTGLGHFKPESQFTRVKGDIECENIIKIACSADFVLALNDKGQVFGWGNTEYSQVTMPDGSQQICDPIYIEMCKSLGKIKDVAAGGSFCVVVNEEGDVFVWGYGLLGTGPDVQRSTKPLQIPSTLFGCNDFQPDSQVESIMCGISHIAAITNYGDVYTWGQNRCCCLGLGILKDQYFPLKVCLGGRVKQVFCGLDHTIALCKPFI